jgi:fucose permease
MNRKNGPLSLLVISYFAFVVLGMPGGVLNIAWTYMQPTFHVELDSLGILLGVGTVGYLIMSFINGRVIGRLGISKALLSGSLLSALGMLIYVLVPTWETLVAFSIIASMGSGIIDAGLNTFVSAHYSAGRLNWLHAAFGVGATLGPLVATFTITRLDQSWRLSYGIAMILFVILSLCFFLTRQRWTLSLDETPDTRAPNVSFMETLRAPLVIPLVGLFFLYAGLEVSTAQLANTLFIDGRGISQETAGTWISFYWFSFTAGRVIMGFFADRLTAQLIVRSGAIGAILGGLLLALNIAPAFSFLGLALIGFALAPIFATLVAETPKRVGMRHAANTIGFEVGMAGLGIAMLPGLGGFLAQRVDLEIIGPFLVGVAVVMYALHEYVVFRETRIVVPEPAPVGQD